MLKLVAVILALVVLAAPLAGETQQATKLPTIGLLAPSTPSTDGQRIAAFSQRLRELGWTEGRNIAFEHRWAEGRSERFAELAAELVRLKVEVIVTWGTPIYATKQATSVIPIVFAVAGDPVGTGLVASLARPGGNVTGFSTQHTEMQSKRLQILREVVPNLRRLAIMGNIGTAGAVVAMRELREMAPTLGLSVTVSEVRQSEDLAPAFQTLKGHVDALLLYPDFLFNKNRNRIAALALDARLPTMHGFREPVEAGGLLSYGPDYLDLFRRTADYVDKILKGAKPADLPIEQPTKFELVINMKTAKALGLTIPQSLLLRADQVIE
jgi:putative tryptophan/tyrosine transport system substrate-binding protein